MSEKTGAKSGHSGTILRARACIKCKEYVIIHAENAQGYSETRGFDTRHSGHTIVTVNVDELADSAYKKVSGG